MTAAWIICGLAWAAFAVMWVLSRGSELVDDALADLDEPVPYTPVEEARCRCTDCEAATVYVTRMLDRRRSEIDLLERCLALPAAVKKRAAS